MKILITGSNGLLGQKLIYTIVKNKSFEVIATAVGANRTTLKEGYRYEEMDVSDAKQVEEVIQKYKPDCVIHTAAMTNVDACETDQEKCTKLNIHAVQYIIDACKKSQSYLCFLSTDFVFDGLNGPYKETDAPNPLSYYAESKLKGEQLVLQSGLKASVLRTIIIYGVVDDDQRSNVVLWTINSLSAKKNIHVINDQFRAPTLAEDLATACIEACVRRSEGIYHISGPETKSILDIVYEVADFFHLDKQYINPISTASLNQAAQRPLRTGFVLDKAIKDLNYKPHTFQEGLQIVKEQIQKKSLV
ncbi:MAG TPA: SDR family oxidoreductase [Bacteroidia bacterium]|nr:SDR family oxidoreductase [Bacteroidia bacterium]HNT79971.1 SDR family oxidoreductase [Bacteroidia bacterium]